MHTILKINIFFNNTFLLMSHPILKLFFCADIQLYRYYWNLEEVIFPIFTHAHNLYFNIENGSYFVNKKLTLVYEVFEEWN